MLRNAMAHFNKLLKYNKTIDNKNLKMSHGGYELVPSGVLTGC